MKNSRNLEIARALRAHEHVLDRRFDRVYPDFVERASGWFWTPVEVGLTVAEWLRKTECDSVLDVGSGPGKFCIVASLASDCSVQGIEQRGRLVETARAAAASYGAGASFEHGTIDKIDPGRFEAFYFYNPFGENYYADAECFDDQVELSPVRHARDLSVVEAWLQEAAPGTCVITYHGFGGRIPDTYTLLRSQEKGSDVLRLWMKRRSGRTRGFFLELGEVVLASPELDKLSDQLNLRSVEVSEIMPGRVLR